MRLCFFFTNFYDCVSNYIKKNIGENLQHGAHLGHLINIPKLFININWMHLKFLTCKTWLCTQNQSAGREKLHINSSLMNQDYIQRNSLMFEKAVRNKRWV